MIKKEKNIHVIYTVNLLNVIYQCYLQTKPKDKKYIASSDFSIKYIIIIIKYLNCHNYTCTDLFNQYNCNSTNFKIKLLDLHLKMFHDEKQGNWMLLLIKNNAWKN